MSKFYVEENIKNVPVRITIQIPRWLYEESFKWSSMCREG